MNKLKPHIYFRADASQDIGYGHFVRTLALADMLGEGFHKTFVTRDPSEYQICQMESVCDDFIALEENHFDQFLDLLNFGDMVVLDNYFFTTNYQRQIKDKGCQLVCIDDMHDKHYVADVVINHGLNDPSLFSVEAYTRLCLGLGWALLRRPFLEATRTPRLGSEKGHCVVAFGGADVNNLTEKICKLLSQKENVHKITAIIGDAYAHAKTLTLIPKVEIEKNLSAQQVADLFHKVEFAVLPTSTICIEAIACGLPVLAGHYVDNQIECYEQLIAMNKITGLGDFIELEDIDTSSIEDKGEQMRNPITYDKVFDDLVAMNFVCDQYQFVNYTDVDTECQKKIYDARNDVNVRKHMDNDRPFDFAQHLEFIKTLETTKNKIYWAVFKHGSYIGSTDINPLNVVDKTCEWGLFLDPNYFGTGVGIDVEYYSLNYLFKSLGINEVQVSVKTTNTKSLKLQYLCTFKLIGQDALYYHLKTTKDTWSTVPSTLNEFKTKVFEL